MVTISEMEMVLNLWNELQHKRLYSKNYIARISKHYRQFWRSKLIKELFENGVFKKVGNKYLFDRKELWNYINQKIDEDEELKKMLKIVKGFEKTFTVLPFTWTNVRKWL